MPNPTPAHGPRQASDGAPTLLQICQARAAKGEDGVFPLGLRSTAKELGVYVSDVPKLILELVRDRKLELVRRGAFGVDSNCYRLVDKDGAK